MYDIGLHYRRMNIWRYNNGFSRSKRSPATQYEPFLWFSKSSKTWTYNADDVRVPYKSAKRLKIQFITPIKKVRERFGHQTHMVPYVEIFGNTQHLLEAFISLSEQNIPLKNLLHFLKTLSVLFVQKRRRKIQWLYTRSFSWFWNVRVCCELLNKEGHDISG